MGSIKKRPLRAFIRYDGKGRIVAGSLVLRRKMPKVGKWKEIAAYECCVSSDPNCVEYKITVGAETVNIYYTQCDGTAIGPVEIAGPTTHTVCAKRDTIGTTGSPTVEELGLCADSTTTTTTTTAAP